MVEKGEVKSMKNSRCRNMGSGRLEEEFEQLVKEHEKNKQRQRNMIR